VAYNDHQPHQDVDRQQITEIFHLRDDSSDEYQNSNICDPLTSGVSYYSSMATHRATTLAVQRSCPEGEQDMPGHEHIWPETNSRRNTAIGAEGAVVVRAKGLILLYTLFDEPLPGVVALTT